MRWGWQSMELRCFFYPCQLALPSASITRWSGTTAARVRRKWRKCQSSWHAEEHDNASFLVLGDDWTFWYRFVLRVGPVAAQSHITVYYYCIHYYYYCDHYHAPVLTCSIANQNILKFTTSGVSTKNHLSKSTTLIQIDNVCNQPSNGAYQKNYKNEYNEWTLSFSNSP